MIERNSLLDARVHLNIFFCPVIRDIVRYALDFVKRREDQELDFEK